MEGAMENFDKAESQACLFVDKIFGKQLAALTVP
jgi:hypothetical protein